MRLNHLNLAVDNVPEAKACLVKYFGFKPMKPDTDNPKFALVRDEAGMILTLMGGAKNEPNYPANFHIGFALESEAAVNAVYQRLADDGFVVDAPARLHGSWTFYFRMPGGVLVEVLSWI